MQSRAISDQRFCSIRYRNGVDLTKAEDIKKKWQEYTEELYKKDLYDPDNHNAVTFVKSHNMLIVLLARK